MLSSSKLVVIYGFVRCLCPTGLKLGGIVAKGIVVKEQSASAMILFCVF